MGLALAKLLASRGAKLSICDIVQSNLDNATKEIETKDLLTFKCDVRSIDQVHEWISKTVNKYGRLDGAANMAGIIGRKPGSNFIGEQVCALMDRFIISSEVIANHLNRLHVGRRRLGSNHRNKLDCEREYETGNSFTELIDTNRV